MTHQQYIECVIACLIGNLLHVFIKIRGLAKDHKIANLEFSVGAYLKDDKWALIVDVLASFAMVYLIEEWISDLGNYAINKLKSIFVFVGFSGSYIILQIMSVSKKKFQQAIDFKSNKSDELDGTRGAPTPTGNNKP